MSAPQIFGLQFVMSLVVYGLVAHWYVAPRLAELPLVWLFSVVGTVDLLNALVQGNRLHVQLGAPYHIPTVAVPALLVTHVMIFAMLITRRR